MSLNLVTNIYNEEYLLPAWLEYHVKIFENAYVIDHVCTDKSVELVKKICPKWKIVLTTNLKSNKKESNFDTELNDVHIRELERLLPDYKICLNTTEWLIFTKPWNEINKKDIMLCKVYIPLINYTNDKNVNLENFFTNFLTRVVSEDYSNSRRFDGRIIHNKKDIQYTPGRHSSKLPEFSNSKRSSEMFIIWNGFYPNTEKFWLRKLQISNNISHADLQKKQGFQHRYSMIQHYNDLRKYEEHSEYPDKFYLTGLKYTLNNYID